MLFYRLLFSLAFPLLLIRAAAEALRSRSLAPLSERLGLVPAAKDPTIWLHAASVGEVTSVRPLIDRLLTADPALRLHVTVNTATARSLAAGWNDARIRVTFAPLDHRLALARFLARTRPLACITAESELWPNRLAALHDRRIPVILVSARLSERSARRWALFREVADQLLGPIAYLSPQDTASADRFSAIGINPARIGPVLALKALAAASPTATDAVLPFQRPFTLLAASTHEGEDAVILDAYLAAHAHQPALRLIIAPRHPARRDGIEALILARSVAFATRSRGQPAVPETQVYLADTIGEMPLWYAASGMTFVGGSLVPKGGHTPFEPAAAGSVILSGPDVANFAAPFAALRAADAMTPVTDAATLAAALADLADPGLQRRRATAARAALAPFAPREALNPLLVAIAAATGRPALAPARERPFPSD